MPKEPKNNGRPVEKPNNHPGATSDRRGYQTRPRMSVSWDEVSNQLIRDTVVAVTNAGCAVIFSRTSDEGALSLTVLDGQKRIREWEHTIEGIEATLSWVVEMYEGD